MGSEEKIVAVKRGAELDSADSTRRLLEVNCLVVKEWKET
jgi:hypothetical protein